MRQDISTVFLERAMRARDCTLRTSPLALGSTSSARRPCRCDEHREAPLECAGGNGIVGVFVLERPVGGGKARKTLLLSYRVEHHARTRHVEHAAEDEGFERGQEGKHLRTRP